MSEPTTVPAPGERATPGLDEIMLAMDVVDTIRHRELLVARELDAGRDDALRTRLREIYRGQGIDVPDSVIDDGIHALKESRFVYVPPAAGWKRSLALAWIGRRRTGRWMLGGLFALAVLVGGYQVGVVLPRERAVTASRLALSDTLPRTLASAHAAVMAEAAVDAARRRADELLADGQAAVARADAAGARDAVDHLEELRRVLHEEYTLRIVSRPGEPSGVFRIPDDNRAARNYYLIVEAFGADRNPLVRSITSEEDGRTAAVTKWGVRVDQAVYEEVGRDKRDDGILEHDVVAVKRAGDLEPSYVLPVRGGAITKW